jgi:Glycosyl transferase family 2
LILTRAIGLPGNLESCYRWPDLATSRAFCRGFEKCFRGPSSFNRSHGKDFDVNHRLQSGGQDRRCHKERIWTDEIVLADSRSIDGTAEIAERLGARVVQIPLATFSELRNRAADACSHEWILSLDSDERCTAEVRDEILALLADGPKFDAYYIPRRNFFMGR